VEGAGGEVGRLVAVVAVEHRRQAELAAAGAVPAQDRAGGAVLLAAAAALRERVRAGRREGELVRGGARTPRGVPTAGRAEDEGGGRRARGEERRRGDRHRGDDPRGGRAETHRRAREGLTRRREATSWGTRRRARDPARAARHDAF